MFHVTHSPRGWQWKFTIEADGYFCRPDFDILVCIWIDMNLRIHFKTPMFENEFNGISHHVKGNMTNAVRNVHGIKHTGGWFSPVKTA